MIRDEPADHARLDCLRGQLALHLGDPTRAAARFRAALQLEPQDRGATHGLGTALERLGDPQAPEFLRAAARHDELKRLISECGHSRKIDLKVFPRLGPICESLDRLDQARVRYQVAIAWDPLDSQAQAGLARLDRKSPAPAPGPVRGPGSPR